MRIYLLSVPLLLLFNVALSQANTKAPQVKITIEKDIYEYAMELLDGHSIDEINSFNHAHCQRDVVDFILVQRALRLGGLNIDFTFELGNYDTRNLKLIESGLLLVSFDTIWLEDAKLVEDHVFISDAIIRNREYYAGVFAAPNNIAQLSSKIKTDFSQVSVVSSRYWYADWKTLNALSPMKLIDESDWIVMAKMVSRGWVDVMLVPFTNSQPFEYAGHGYQISAIPNIKVALQDSRHFVVSKKHPLGQATFNALQVGLKQLRENGFIERAYRQCGFLNNTVESWQTLPTK